MISESLGLIVPEIPKCGPCSMYDWLKTLDGALERKDHIALNQYPQYMTQPAKNYTVIMMGRNPYTRAVSAYEYAQYAENDSNFRGLCVLEKLNDVTFQGWYNSIKSTDLARGCGPEGYTFETEGEFLDGSFRPQTAYACVFDDSRSMDAQAAPELLENARFLQLESANMTLSHFMGQKVELPYVNTHKETLETNNEGLHGSYRMNDWTEYYTDKDIVTQIKLLYADDFTLWGYDEKINPYTGKTWEETW